ncbi:MAG: hypothetical protein EOO47_09405 [Flavobacterium sp.]|nr:MAG: hypothetical protein EOO47_09405 [Flavobacterium sp.]
MDILRNFFIKYEKALGFVICIFLFLILRKIHELAAPIVLVALIVFGLLYSIFTTYRYRIGKLNYIVFKTYNDDYAGFEALFFSLTLLIGGGLMSYFDYIETVWFSMAFLVAMLLFVNSRYSMPSGFLKFKKGLLKLYGVNKVMEIENIKSIDIYNNRIVIKSMDEKVWLSSNLKIEESKAEEIICSLTDKLAGYPIKITNQVKDVK